MSWQTEGIKAGAQWCVHYYLKHPCQVSDITFSSPAHRLIIFVILAEDAAILQYIGILISCSPFLNPKKHFVEAKGGGIEVITVTSALMLQNA